MTERKRAISTPRAPAAIGPYSQAIAMDGWLHCSGQIPLDPETGSIVGDDVAAQTRQVLTNLENVLRAAGCTLDDVVKANVYLVDLGEFQAMNEVYAEYFKARPPARACVQVAALPKGSLVEIDCIARLDR
ncbi:MAG: RidA family protein [Planctomycetes bacterium]|nr:RidA family protein [Planctomycetota bacterium]